MWLGKFGLSGKLSRTNLISIECDLMVMADKDNHKPMTEIVDLIHDHEETEKYLTQLIKKTYHKNDPVIIEAMKFPSLKTKNIKHTFNKYFNKGNKRLTCMFSNIEEHNNIAYLEHRSDLYILNKESLYIPNASTGYYWDDVIASPSEFIYLYPHSPHDKKHVHFGFRCYDEKTSKYVFNKMKKVIRNVRKKDFPIQLPPFEHIVNMRYFQLNKRQLLKVKQPKNFKVIAGTLFNTNDMDFFDNRQSYSYLFELEFQ